MTNESTSPRTIEWYAELGSGMGRAATLSADLRAALALALRDRAQELAEAIQKEHDALEADERARAEQALQSIRERRQAALAAERARARKAERDWILNQRVRRAVLRSFAVTFIVGWSLQSLWWWRVLSPQTPPEGEVLAQILLIPLVSLPVLGIVGAIIAVRAANAVRSGR